MENALDQFTTTTFTSDGQTATVNDNLGDTIGQFSGMTDYNYIGAGPRSDTLAGTYSYDTADRLTGLDYTSNGGQNAIDNYRWAYNAGNLVTSFTTDTGTASYALPKLAGATRQKRDANIFLAFFAVPGDKAVGTLDRGCF